jgi:hypothetical protein
MALLGWVQTLAVVMLLLSVSGGIHAISHVGRIARGSQVPLLETSVKGGHGGYKKVTRSRRLTDYCTNLVRTNYDKERRTTEDSTEDSDTPQQEGGERSRVPGKKQSFYLENPEERKLKKKLPNGQKIAQRTTRLHKEFPNSPLGGGITFLNTVKIRLIRLQIRRSFFLQLFFGFLKLFSRNPRAEATWKYSWKPSQEA